MKMLIRKKQRICALCEKIIEEHQSHYKYLDNYLQAKFFDSDEDNVFCSKECAGNFMCLTEIYPKKQN